MRKNFPVVRVFGSTGNKVNSAPLELGLSLVIFKARSRMEGRQKSPKAPVESWVSPRRLSLTTMAPTMSLATTPTRMILLGENLPRMRDLRVEFSMCGWMARVEPDMEHHGFAVTITTPCMEEEVEQVMEVQVRLVNTNTGEESSPQQFFFLSSKEGNRKILEKFNPNLTFVREKHNESKKKNKKNHIQGPRKLSAEKEEKLQQSHVNRR